MKCAIAWSSLYVQADGKVTPCCGDLAFGNVTEGLSAVFNGEKATRLREQMLSDSPELPDVCSHCSLLMRLGSDNTFPRMFPWISDTEWTASADLLKSYQRLWQSYDNAVLPPPGSHPLSLMVQFGELCNIRCIMCPQDHTNPIMISEEAVARIKEEIPFIVKIVFTGGEPTAFAQCWDITEHFNLHAPREAYLGILTNLKSVTKERVERYFSRINNFGLGINVDAVDKSTYEHIRRGANWEQFNQNLADLLEYKRANRKDHWNVNLTMTLMKSNLAQIVDLIKWCGALGVGFGCGPITGDYGPVKNARTYLEENIFRYPHLGLSKEDIIATLQRAMEATACLAEPYREGAQHNISGMIEFTRKTPQVEIAPDDLERLRASCDDELAPALQCLVLEGIAPWNKPPETPPAPESPPPPPVPLWRRAGRKLVRMLTAKHRPQ